MHAWRLHTIGEGLHLDEIPTPSPGKGEVVLRIEAAGLCHTDLAFMHGNFPISATLPITLGHEFAGVVHLVGPDVIGVEPGDRVGYASDGPSTPGVGRDGGYADYVLVPAKNLVTIPDGVGFAQAAAGTDAGKNAWNAIHVAAKVQPGERVAIVGLGGLGMVGARIAVLVGAEVYAADPKPEAREAAAALGVLKVVGHISELPRNTFDVIIDFAGFETTQNAVDLIAPNGRIIQVAAARREATIDLQQLIGKNATLRGMVTTDSPAAIREVYKLLADGDLEPTLSTIGFHEISDGLERLRRGEVLGRLVAVR